jgi:integrase/recombinase XerD
VSALAERLADYLALRRAVGFKLERQGRLLPQFVAYLDEIGAETITVESALAWAVNPGASQPGRVRERVSMVRSFARYLQAFDPAAQVPPTNLVAAQRRPVPYLFTEAEIAALLGAAAATLRSPLRAATYRTLIGLLAVTGMRGCEARGLDRDDVDLDAGLLTIRQTKFNQSRQLPLHASTVAALRGYTHVRDALCPDPKTPAFFLSLAGTRLVRSNMSTTFRALVGHVGLKPRDGSGPPRLHALRHTFAVSTLLAWYRDGQNVAARIPLLSAYLGHAKPASTYWYLQAAPELLAAAAARLEPLPGAWS